MGGRDVVASSQEMGQDLDHVTILRDKFRDFARETGMVGQERVDYVNQTIDELIKAGHTEAAAMADWRDSVNESWADLLELIDTRAQLLQASHDLLKSVCTQMTANGSSMPLTVFGFLCLGSKQD
uniref:Uncharacterized protein n=1 Tax=Hucho hucho TaxID=62062 RepID=A0A4W5LGG3_9TELE